MPLNKKLRIIFLSFLALISASSFASDNTKYVLTLVKKDNTMLHYSFESKPKIEFYKNSFTITTTYGQDVFSFNGSFEKFIIEDASKYPTTSVSDLSNKLDYKIEDNYITAYNVGTNPHVSVLSIDGKNMPVESTNDGQNLTVYLSSYSKGIYIIKINNFSCKFYKK